MEKHGTGRLSTSRGRTWLLTLVAVVMVTGPAMVLDATSATSASAGPTGYTTLFDDAGCQLATVDLGAGGAVTPVPGSPVFGEDDGCPSDLAIRAGDARIWAVVQPCPGQACSESSPGLGLGLPGTTGTGADAPAPVSDGQLVGAFPSAVLVTIDRTTGARTTVGQLGFAAPSLEGSGALAFDAAGTLWFYNFSFDDPQCVVPPDADPGFPGQCLYRLDTTTGAATFVANGPTANPVDDRLHLVYQGTASCENVLANVITDPNPVDEGLSFALNTVNTATGALTPRPTGYGSSYMFGIERDASGTLRGIGVTDREDLGGLPATFTIDPVTGAATKVAGLTLTSDFFLGLAITGLVCPAITATIVDGNSVLVTGSGFPPNTEVTVDIQSTPLVLGTLTADANGAFSKKFTLPCSVEPGSHTVTATAATGEKASAGVTTVFVCATPRFTG